MTTYAEREESANDSEPIELYRFWRTVNGLTEVWPLANGEVEVTFGEDVFAPIPGIHRGEIHQSSENSSMQLDIELPRIACFTDQLKAATSPAPIFLEIIRQQRGLADTEYATIFQGELSGIVFERGLVKITCTCEEGAWNDALGRVFTERKCPHMFGDEFCGKDLTEVTFTSKITNIDATRKVITVEELPDLGAGHLDMASTYYRGGVLDWQGFKFFITAQDADEVTLQLPLPSLAADEDLITLQAGCDRSSENCVDHDNIERFGGFKLLPERSPWEGVR
jgi:hypothetical protein